MCGASRKDHRTKHCQVVLGNAQKILLIGSGVSCLGRKMGCELTSVGEGVARLPCWRSAAAVDSCPQKYDDTRFRQLLADQCVMDVGVSAHLTSSLVITPYRDALRSAADPWPPRTYCLLARASRPTISKSSLLSMPRLAASAAHTPARPVGAQLALDGIRVVDLKPLLDRMAPLRGQDKDRGQGALFKERQHQGRLVPGDEVVGPAEEGVAPDRGWLAAADHAAVRSKCGPCWRRSGRSADSGPVAPGSLWSSSTADPCRLTRNRRATPPRQPAQEGPRPCSDPPRTQTRNRPYENRGRRGNRNYYAHRRPDRARTSACSRL